MCVVLGVGVARSGPPIMRDRDRGGLFALLVVLLLLAGGRVAVIPIVVIPMALLLDRALRAAARRR